jgi:hypothetical protein
LANVTRLVIADSNGLPGGGEGVRAGGEEFPGDPGIEACFDDGFHDGGAEALPGVVDFVAAGDAAMT